MAASVDVILRKFLAENINEALSSMSFQGEVSKGKIKATRKAVKKVRTILKILSSSVKGDWSRTEEAILKDISREFKELRNIFIVEEVFQEVIPLIKKEKVQCEVDEVVKLFEQLENQAVQSFRSDTKKIKNIIGDLQVAFERLDEMLFKSSPWESILEGVEETYRDCAKLYKTLCKSGSDDNCIFLRKTVNFLHVELDCLQFYRRADSKEYFKNLEAFSKSLGHVQDSILIIQVVKDNKKKFANTDHYKNLVSFMEKYKDAHAELLPKSGKTLFEESAKGFMEKCFDLEKIKEEKKKFKEKKSLF